MMHLDRRVDRDSCLVCPIDRSTRRLLDQLILRVVVSVTCSPDDIGCDAALLCSSTAVCAR